jgi:hypothetical protein
MTPLKSIVRIGLAILTRDDGNMLTLQCIASNERNAEWLAGSLAAHHGVEVEIRESSWGATVSA